MRFLFLLSLSVLAPISALAQSCEVDMAAVEARIAELERRFSLVLSDIGCDVNTIPARQLMCDSAETPNSAVWRMGRLDTLAWVSAVENATGQEVDLENPPLDQDFVARRDACTDEACLCDVLIQHTNDSLGGTSPYPQ